MSNTQKELKETIDMLYDVAKKEDDVQLALKARGIIFWIFGYLKTIVKDLEKE